MIVFEKDELPAVLPLDKRYTRTYYQDDSFVSNIRRALPRMITAVVMEEHVFPNLSKEEIDFLLQYYAKKQDISGDYYQLKTIPYRIRKDSAERIVKEAAIDETQLEFISNFYQFDSELQQYVLKDKVTEADEIRILQIVKRRDYYVGNVEKSKISSIFERFAEIPKKDTFFANLYVPPNHKFFSPPNLKHISGMQIVEAARQFGIACNHMFGKVPFEGVTFLLLYLNSEFFQYAKMNMPIKLRAIAKETKFSKSGYWNYSKLEITAYQENQEITKIEMAASILPLKVYKRLKSTQEEVYEIDPRFRVLDQFKNNISIRENGRNIVSTIENISSSGFMVRCSGIHPGELADSGQLEFFMHFDIVGFVHGTCILLWIKEDDNNEDTFFAGFRFEIISELDRANVKEAINRYGRLIEEREIQ
ncbi:pilus assembly protein PilZ [Leptospira sp. 2 VSF19]|uniref:Pilus assembly protein PilZ n=1 Tax=Leptospira soteropolitanensis TaxID=2950025 RepID=A0AAW5VQ51_9LEPT|nr:AfsA-related hotdog domain-containing protein [Leptospira soteropolitanensis]MCW7493432.1 pilus assembly protein PilZ [Leptospira soteropolitanensis]MCW7501036.1 pilus assembly protein PilZ [Leptospira soteropolitanensis]MCW7523284.1 pilus assembly protein PilZ [Leptospira soteropolitanensis]MCW7527145.1 pilus assembly protein PilZ [Leptospira soteropolitanensis]MCW7531002.1 pilus assembly protein PilZ [Leptospira soteropolitanensis]